MKSTKSMKSDSGGRASHWVLPTDSSGIIFHYCRVITVLVESPLVWIQNLQSAQSQAETRPSKDGSECVTKTSLQDYDKNEHD